MDNLNISLLDELPNSHNISLLKSSFITLKEQAPKHYHEGTFSYRYEQYLKKLLHYRLKMLPSYVCDVTITEKSCSKEDILDYIVYKLREYILCFLEGRYQSVDQVDLTDACIVCSFKVKDICDELNIPCEKVEIHPGYNIKARLFGLCGFHYFNIVTINNKKYIIDGTYKQFFKENVCLVDEIGVPLTCAPSPGFFMKLTKDRQEVAKKILKDGWIELTDDTLKAYCDGFTLSYRNGLYYETFSTTDFKTEYTGEDYLRFLKGEDNQTNHEPIECLGPLKKVLSAPFNLK